MKKIILVTSILVVLIAISFVLFLSLPKEQEEIIVDVPQPIATTTNIFPIVDDKIPVEPVINLDNDEGEETEVINFLLSSSTIPDESNPGYYFLGNTFFPDSNNVQPNYVIIYDNTNDFFNVTLLKEPLKSSRLEAEFYLESALNIGRSEMCSLQYTLTVPAYVNEEMSGTDYRFSFCAGAISL